MVTAGVYMERVASGGVTIYARAPMPHRHTSLQTYCTTCLWKLAVGEFVFLVRVLSNVVNIGTNLLKSLGRRLLKDGGVEEGVAGPDPK